MEFLKNIFIDFTPETQRVKTGKKLYTDNPINRIGF